MSKQKQGRAGLLVREEWLGRGHVYPRKGERWAERVCWAVLCMGRTVTMWGWARFYFGALQRTGWGRWVTVDGAGGHC